MTMKMKFINQIRFIRNNGHIYFEDTLGAIANFTNEIITFEGVSVAPKTIFNSNTSIFDIPDEVFKRERI